MRPLVVLRYRAANVRTEPSASIPAEDLLQLENVSDVDAFDISVSSIAIDPRHPHEFDPVPALPSHGSWLLGITPAAPSLAAAISRRVVADVLARRTPPTHWPVRIAYRDDDGRTYATACEIRVIRLPLTIAAVVVRDGERVPTAGRDPVRSREPAAAERY
jgi:hypothetical protein